MFRDILTSFNSSDTWTTNKVLEIYLPGSEEYKLLHKTPIRIFIGMFKDVVGSDRKNFTCCTTKGKEVRFMPRQIIEEDISTYEFIWTLMTNKDSFANVLLPDSKVKVRTLDRSDWSEEFAKE